MRTLSAMVAACATLLWAGAVLATLTPQQKCENAKITARTKYRACVAKLQKFDVKFNNDFSTSLDTSTCQQKLSDALAKADAKALAKGASCRYLPSQDGTVADLNTGLVWEQKTNASGIHDVNNLYTWASSGTTPNGTAFTDLLGTLNGGTSSDGTNTPTPCFAFHCDWRLPTIQELQGITDLSATGCSFGSPCIDPVFGATQSDFYWSSSMVTASPNFAWVVDFYYGHVSGSVKWDGGYVRAVRGGL